MNGLIYTVIMHDCPPDTPDRGAHLDFRVSANPSGGVMTVADAEAIVASTKAKLDAWLVKVQASV